MPRYELEISIDSLPQQNKNLALDVINWHIADAVREIACKIENKALADLGFEKSRALQRCRKPCPGLGSDLVIGQLADHVLC